MMGALDHVSESTWCEEGDDIPTFHACTIPQAMRNLGWSRGRVLRVAVEDAVLYDAPPGLPGNPKTLVPLSWVELQGVSTTPVTIVVDWLA